MPHSAAINPDTFPTYTDVSLDVILTAGESIYAGSIIEIQLPNSFTNDRVSPSKVKPWQLDNPDEPHFIGLSAGSLPRSALKADIRAREYVGGYHVPTRHGRCLIVEIAKGTIQIGERFVVTYRNTTSSWLANQAPGTSDHEGQVLIMVDGVKVTPSPQFRVLPGPSVPAIVKEDVA
jgi:hypothetical protein